MAKKVKSNRRMILGTKLNSSFSVTFTDIEEASKAGYLAPSISKSIKHDKPYKGFKWSYVEAPKQIVEREYKPKTKRTKISFLEQYQTKVENGDIRASIYVKYELNRLKLLMEQDNITYDNEQIINDIYWVEDHFKFSNGSDLKLLLWQKAFIEALYSFKLTTEKTIQTPEGDFEKVQVTEDYFKELYLEMARKSGKTETIGVLNIIELKRLSETDKTGYTLHCLSATKNNANILYEATKQIMNSNEQWRDSFSKLDGSWKIRDDEYDNSLSVIAGNMTQLQSIKSQLLTIDEIHLLTDDLLGHARNSQKSNKNAKILMITTAGTKRHGLYDKLLTQFIQIMAKNEINSRTLNLRYCLDSLEEVEDPMNYIKAMPSIGVTYALEDIIEEIKELEDDDDKRVDFVTTMFNIPQNPSTAYFNEVHAKRQEFDEDAIFRDRYVIVGADLSLSRDFTSISIIAAENTKIYVKDLSFIPGSSLDHMSEHKRKHYQVMIDNGDLIPFPGATIDNEMLADYVNEWLDERNLLVPLIGYDEWNCKDFIRPMKNRWGTNALEKVRQGAFTWSEPFKTVRNDMFNGRIYHNSAVLEDAIMNVIAKVDTNNNRIPDKMNSDCKIDPFMAFFDAYIVLKRTGYEKYCNFFN